MTAAGAGSTLGRMLIWINGAFGAGKTTLAGELKTRLPDALDYDPEYVGYLLTKWVPAPESRDFQDLPLWRRMVAEFAIGLWEEYRRPLIVPMTLVNPAYRDEIFAALPPRTSRCCTCSSTCRPTSCAAASSSR